MLTYVINTSENKTFDSNLLFELVGYRQIQWKHCSLSRISECAEEIYKEIDALSVAERDRFRIVVLVDFFSFPFCKKTQHEAAADIVNIYKKYIRLYLTQNLHDYLSVRDRVPADYAIYYIQYVNNESRKTAMEKALAAQLFRVEKPEEKSAEAAKEEGEKKKETADSEEQAGKATLEAEKKGPKKEPVLYKLEKEVAELAVLCREGSALEKPVLLDNADSYTAFYLFCGENNYLKIHESKTPMTFEAFFNRYGTNISANCADKQETVPYVTFSTSDEHAAYDVLCMSLFLVWRYECLHDEGREMLHIETARPDPKRLQEVLLSAFGDIHKAQETSLKNACLYYSLEQATAHVRDVKDDEDGENLKNEVIGTVNTKPLPFDDEYVRICQYASATSEQEIPNEDRQAINEAMRTYLEARDEKKDEAETEEDFKRSGLFVANSASCPSELEKKKLLDKQRNRMKELLNDALGAGYNAGDFSEEKEKADEIYNEYKRTKASMKRSFVGDLLLFVVTLLGMLLPYAFFQNIGNPFSPGALIAYGIAAGVFGGLLLLCLLLHILPIMRKLDRLKHKMHALYESCCIKNRKALQPLFSRYKNKLLTIEDIRYSVRRIERLDTINRRKNARAEEHRELLEALENTISGILSSMHIITSFSSTQSEIDFDIEKDVADNGIYHVFSAKNIETLFEQGGHF